MDYPIKPLIDEMSCEFEDGVIVRSGFLDKSRRILYLVYLKGDITEPSALEGIQQHIKHLEIAEKSHNWHVHIIADVTQVGIDPKVLALLQTHPSNLYLQSRPNIGVQILVSTTDFRMTMVRKGFDDAVDRGIFNQQGDYNLKVLRAANIKDAIKYLRWIVKAEGI